MYSEIIFSICIFIYFDFFSIINKFNLDSKINESIYCNRVNLIKEDFGYNIVFSEFISI